VEEQLAAGPCEGQVAELVEYDQFKATKLRRQIASPTHAGLLLEAVHQVDGVEILSAHAGADHGGGDRYREMRFSRAGPTDEDDVAPCVEEAARVGAERPSRSLIGVPSKAKASRLSVRGDPGRHQLDQIVRAHFLEATIEAVLLARVDRVDRGLHIVVDAVPRYLAQHRKGARVRVEDHVPHVSRGYAPISKRRLWQSGRCATFTVCGAPACPTRSWLQSN